MRKGHLLKNIFVLALLLQGGCADLFAKDARAQARHERNPIDADRLEQVREEEQEDKLLRVFVAPGSWAAALSRLEGQDVERRNVAAIGCVGEISTDMFCSWQRRRERKWERYSGRADLSQETPQIRNQRADELDDR